MTHQPLSIAAAGTTALRAWRKRQLVDDPDLQGHRRTMRLIDVERLYGVPRATWAQWEKPHGDPGSRLPDESNMRRLFEITRGEITPEHFYPLDEWRSELAGEG